MSVGLLTITDYQSLLLSATETLYFFGGNNPTDWQRLFKHYESPPYVLPHTSGAYSFGVAGWATTTIFCFDRSSKSYHLSSYATLVSRPWNRSPLSLAWSWFC